MEMRKGAIKAFNIRIPKELWAFIKKRSVDEDRSMNELITLCLDKFKKRIENKLTSDDTLIS